MINNIICIELTADKIDTAILENFDCGHADFNEYLLNDAIKMAENGEGVTYVLVFQDEYESGCVKSILAFATISTMALLYNAEDKIHCIPSVEIKYFAIDKIFQKATAFENHRYKWYSVIFFEVLLMHLYFMSMHSVGFRAIFLRANKNGENLYRRKLFVDADNYMIPYSDDDPLEQCVPLVLFVQDNLHSVFGCE